jgi:hypothetical protein
MVGSAKKDAESIRSTGHAEAERELATIRAEVDRMAKRRDGIVAQLSALKDVVSGFAQDDSDAPAAEAADADPTGSDVEG